MKVRDLIEALEQAVAEVPEYADADVLITDNAYRATKSYAVLGLGTEDGDDEYSAREDVLYVMTGTAPYGYAGEVREWHL